MLLVLLSLKVVLEVLLFYLPLLLLCKLVLILLISAISLDLFIPFNHLLSQQLPILILEPLQLFLFLFDSKLIHFHRKLIILQVYHILNFFSLKTFVEHFVSVCLSIQVHYLVCSFQSLHVSLLFSVHHVVHVAFLHH